MMDLKTYAPHQQIVIDEQSEISSKLSILVSFFDTEIFKGLEKIDQDLLRQQADLMNGYNITLLRRIDRF